MQVFPTSFSPSSTLYWRTVSRFPDFSRYKRCIVIYLFHVKALHCEVVDVFIDAMQLTNAKESWVQGSVIIR